MRESSWSKYIKNNSTRNHMRPLHYQAKLIWVAVKTKKPRALSLGTGDGKEDIDLISRGWSVTGIDSEPYVGDHVFDVLKNMKKSSKFVFQNVSYENAKLSGKYNYIMAFNSLPFGDKKDMPPLFEQIAKHSAKGAVIAMTMFGPTHTFVKRKTCFAMNKKEIILLLESNDFEVLFIERNQYDVLMTNKHWDVFEIIARYNK
jgi:hypothetical protein